MKLSRFIQQQLHPLLAEWDVFAKANAPAGNRMTELALRNHAEQILQAIAVDIDSDQTDAEQKLKSEGQSDHEGATAVAAAVHGALRQQSEFSLLQLTAEYRALRATVLRAWLPTIGTMDAACTRQMVRFNEAIDQALAESVVAYDQRAQQQRVEAERALGVSEARYRGIVNTALDYAIFTTDVDGLIDSWPPGAASVFGWSAEEARGQPVAITYTSEDRDAQVPQQEMRLSREEGMAPNVRWHVCKDGHEVFIEGAMRPLLGADGEPTGYLKVGRDATERKQWDERQQVLLHELQHRTRNLMAVVLNMFEKTRRSSADMDEMSRTYKDRLSALARVQGLLSQLREGDRVAFDTLVRAELSAMGALDDQGRGERIELSGPPGVLLRSGTVQTFALALHELATNATKYGALAQDEGRLAVRWRMEGRDGQPCLFIEWAETCVRMPPDLATPQGGGYGRELIERALPYQLDARTTYELGADGVRCTIVLPISDSAVQEQPSHG